MSVDRRTGAVTRMQRRTLKSHQRAALRLPPADETWTSSAQGISQGPLNAFVATGIIEAVGWTDTPADGRSRVREWRTASGIAEWIEAHISPSTRTPCGCSAGVRTVASGSLFTCCDDECPIRFSRLVAEQVVQNRGPVMGTVVRGP